MKIKGFRRDGFSLIELLVVIMLIFIVSVGFLAIKFPNQEELSQKNPKDALLETLRFAKKLAHLGATHRYIHFLDNNQSLKLREWIVGSGSTGTLQSAITDGDQQNALIQFIQIITGNSPQHWSDVIDEYTTKKPLFYVTDTSNKLVFDDNYPCYSIIQNLNDPSQQISSNPNVFEKLNNSGTDGSNRSASSSFFTVYASGLCDPVHFTANQYCKQGEARTAFELHVDSFGAITVSTK
ncbi:MAG: prepilin-type N-terminal cleavage/methylation domain-containing protein [Puniceicoccales bacterium]|nr:prepilin-type N-terminal cleavage/methylation domain-containing protein [Puniceicoccales bacterium]